MTQTHLLLAAGLFVRPGHKKRNTAVMAGAFIPDLSIYILAAYAYISGIPGRTLWTQTYWTEPWQTLSAISNSFPLYLAVLAVALVIAAPKDGRPRWQSLPALVCLAALLHLATDFPVHHDDAHVHFWPLSEWRFNAPLSYWDRDHYGGIVSIIEALLGLALMAILFRRFKAGWVRIILGLAIAAYIAVPVFFLLTT